MQDIASILNYLVLKLISDYFYAIIGMVYWTILDVILWYGISDFQILIVNMNVPIQLHSQ